jgi:serine/threonine protein kinase
MGNCCNHFKFMRNRKTKKLVKKTKSVYYQFNIGDKLGNYCVTHRIYNKIWLLKKGNKKYVGKFIKNNYRGKYELEILKKNKSQLLPIFQECVECDFYNFIMYQYVSGKDMYDTFVNDIPLNEKKIYPLFKQMLECINHCHQLGYLHLDIKLENFIATPVIDELTGNTSYHITLIDFGHSLPKIIDKILIPDCRGTKGYIAPEILMKFVTAKSDVWSLGCVVYVMLAGKFPFRKSKVQFLQDIYSVDHHFDLLKSIQHLSHPLRELILKMLKPEHDERISIREMMTHRYFNEVIV